MQRKVEKALHSGTPDVLPVLVSATEQEAEDAYIDFAGGRPQLVRTVSQKEVHARANAGLLTRQEWSFISGLALLRRSLRKRDVLAMKNAFDCLFKPPGVEHPDPNWPAGSAMTSDELVTSLMSRPSQYFTAVLATLTSGFWNRALERAKLVFWGQNTQYPQFGLGIYCRDLKTAFVMNLILRDAFHICPRCHRTFKAKRPQQVCCTPKCTRAHRMARWRAQKKRLGE